MVFERAYYTALQSLVKFAAESLGLAPPWQIEFGILGIKGLNIIMPVEPAGWEPWGPVRAQEVVHRAVLNDVTEVALTQFGVHSGSRLMTSGDMKFSSPATLMRAVRPAHFCGWTQTAESRMFVYSL
jgi:hypothetical protein